MPSVRCFLLFLCTNVSLFFTLKGLQAQDSLRAAYNPSNQYVETIHDYITLKLAISSDLENFSVYSGDTKFQINPNTATITTLSANYSFVSTSFRFTPKFFPGNSDTDEKGKSKSLGVGLNLNFNHWMQELSYTRTLGYYLDNTADFRPGWQEGDTYIQFPHLLYKNIQGITGYKFNRNFSLNAIATQSERQLKSSGSFIPQFLYRYYLTDDRTRLENPGQTSQKARNLELLLGAGYFHNFVFRKYFYAALGITPGAGFLFMNLTTRNGNGSTINSRQQDPIFRLDTRVGVGYNGDRIFGGLYATGFVSSYEQNNTNVINGNSRLFFKLFFGYRIPAPAILKENFKALTNKIKHH